MQRSSGFSLVEVLVSIVILSFALLGTAGLMASSLSNTNTSYYRSQATILADDIIDRMRANVTAARTGEYDVTAGPTCAVSAGALASFDCNEWTDTVERILPEGVGTVDVTNGVATIVIVWDNGASSFRTVSQL
jgi:type IV pilus assembly protein PilV